MFILLQIKIEPVTNVTANCGYMLGPSLNDLERNFKHIMPSSGITYFDDNGNIGKGTVARPQVIGKYKLKRIWVVIVDSNVYLHKRFGETCRFVLELKKVQLESSTTSMCLRFILKVDTYPTFEFDCIDSTDALCWKLAFYSAWKSTRETEFNFRTLIDSLRKAKKDKETGDPGDDEASVGSLASRRSMSSIGSVSKAPSFTSQQAGSRQGSIGKFKKKKKNRANHY